MMRKIWINSEKQGGGRRYWFRNATNQNAFDAFKRSQGYHIASDWLTTWVSNGKTRTEEVKRQQAGYEGD